MVKIDSSKYKAFLFDMDGTLINSEPLHFQSVANTLSDYGKEYLTFEGHKKTYTGTGLQNTFTKESEKHGLNVPVETMKEKFHEHLENLVREGGMPAMEGAIDFLRQAKNKGLKTAIVSGSTERLISYSLEESKIPNLFDAIVGIDKYGTPKPDPACYKMAAEILGIKPEECLVFEDAQTGIEAALDAGMEVVVVGETITQEQLDIIKPGLKHVKNFTEIDFSQL
jgi:HAD superfamily hydrolase (TIGR01509 family)